MYENDKLKVLKSIDGHLKDLVNVQKGVVAALEQRQPLELTQVINATGSSELRASYPITSVIRGVELAGIARLYQDERGYVSLEVDFDSLQAAEMFRTTDVQKLDLDVIPNVART